MSKPEWQRELHSAFDRYFPVGSAMQRKKLLKKTERIILKVMKTVVQMPAAELEQLRESMKGKDNG